jgi:formylmethanofuran dehydrogenase subunit E
MDNKVYVSVNSSTANPPSHVSRMEHLDKILASSATADIAVRCVICEEYTPMNSHDCRAQGVFICSKCKAAIKHIRDYLENGGSVV